MLVRLALVSLAFVSTYALPSVHTAHDDHDHEHVEHRALPKRWYHDEDHPVHELFKRAPTDGVSYPPIGSPEWFAAFPPANVGVFPDVNRLPEGWVNALNAAVAAGRIPDIPRSTSRGVGTDPVYPAGVDPSSRNVCSSTAKCRIEGDVWDAPEGVFAHSFDDGPYDGTEKLVGFLQSQRAITTHFMIGTHILLHPRQFQTTFNAGHDMAVHTWNHPYMTTLSNVEIVAQLGWTMQLIHHSTGGRVPRYWRPPYGDSDRRVRAIAKEVLGLDTVIWNRDSNDWGLSTGATTSAGMQAAMTSWITGPKAPGIVHLQHEILERSVDIFINTYPLLQQNGWRAGSLASILNDHRAYQNAQGTQSDDVAPRPNMALSGASPSSSSSLPQPGPSSSSPSGTSPSPSDTSVPDDGLVPSPEPEPSTPSSSSSVSPASWTTWLALCAFVSFLTL